jgi:hypothetical protein
MFLSAGYENLIPMAALSQTQTESSEENQVYYEVPIESGFSKLVRVSDFERYMGDAIYFGLFKAQHAVKWI